MNLLEKAQKRSPSVRRALLAWFRREARDLPWRRPAAEAHCAPDPYRVWVSEVMLQQTRAAAAVPYYERFLAELPDVRALAEADPDRILKLWEGLGYYARARNLQRAARIIVHERAGVWPESAAEWAHLPGVGRYTAAAIASIALGERVAVVDGNVKRVLARLFDIEENVDSARGEGILWDLAQALLAPRAPGDFNQALMELGARVCIPKGVRCGECPLAGQCAARRLRIQEQLPVRRPRKAAPHYIIVAGAIAPEGAGGGGSDGRVENPCYLLGKRPPASMLGGLWEFPGGKVEPGETHAEALARELREELGIEVRIGRHIATVDHAYSHFSITLHVYFCEHAGGEPSPKYHSELRWVRRSDFGRYAFPAADLKFFDRL